MYKLYIKAIYISIIFVLFPLNIMVLVTSLITCAFHSRILVISALVFVYHHMRVINHILLIRSCGHGLNCAVALEAFVSSYLTLCSDFIISTVHYLILRYVTISYVH